MSVGWVAGTVRARLLDRHRIGADGVRAIARSSTLAAALGGLRGSAYPDAFTGGTSVAAVQHAIWATVVWDLRVLAGWLPASGVGTLRTFAGYFEIENIESLLVRLSGGEDLATFDLGALATAWPRVREAGSQGDVRRRLRPSWPEPESDEREDILRSLRLEWARRVGEIGVAAPWGAAAAALVVARAFIDQHDWTGVDLARRAPQLGHRALSASSIGEFVAALPDCARWVFEDVESTDPTASELWIAEARWWRRLDRDGERLVRSTRAGPDVIIGAIGRRMSDAWRTAAALSLVGRDNDEELLDVVA